MWYWENNNVKNSVAIVTLGDTKLSATVFCRLNIIGANQAINVIYRKTFPTLQLRN